jgi:MerR family copper efflux transcriptional regulator
MSVYHRLVGALSIGRVAENSGVTAETIRYYERLGLLPPPARTAAGYRQYSESVVHRLSLIRNAQRFGFSLAAIRGFLRVREAGGTPCREVRAAAQRMLDAMDTQIAELRSTRTRMRHTLRGWDRTLEQTPAGQQALLLETLTGGTRATVARRMPPRRRGREESR